MFGKAADMQLINNGFLAADTERNVAFPIVTVIHHTAAHGAVAVIARLAGQFTAPVKIADRPRPGID